MSLVALDGTPLVAVGGSLIQGQPGILTASNNALAAANAAIIYVGQIFTSDGLSHTIDASGSSAIGWKSAAVTFASGSTTFKVGIGTVDAANGPPARATNSTGTITQSVAASFIGGGGGVTANAWQSSVPTTGSLAIANGDLVAVSFQMTTRGGADTISVQSSTSVGTAILVRPSVTLFDGTSTYTGQTKAPNCIITFSDGAKGYLFGGEVFAAASTTQTWNNGSAAVEYGNVFQLPVPTKIYGFLVSCAASGDTDFVLYSDPLGTPVAEKTTSVDLNEIGQAANSVWFPLLFASPYSTTANQPLAGIIKPTTTTNVSSPYRTFNASGDQNSATLGTNCYAVNRASGAFSAQNSNKDRFAVALLVGAFDNGAGGSGMLYIPNLDGV